MHFRGQAENGQAYRHSSCQCRKLKEMKENLEHFEREVGDDDVENRHPTCVASNDRWTGNPCPPPCVVGT